MPIQKTIQKNFFKVWHSWQIFFLSQIKKLNILIHGLGILAMEAVAKKALNPLDFMLLL